MRILSPHIGNLPVNGKSFTAIKECTVGSCKLVEDSRIFRVGYIERSKCISASGCAVGHISCFIKINPAKQVEISIVNGTTKADGSKRRRGCRRR